MKRLSVVVCAVFCCAAASFGIGLQHGVFRSQSTQGAAWQGTAVIESERFDITVFPDYLDVDLEWVFKVGGTPPDSFGNALEIVGNLNLDAHSTVVGLITWYKGKILKGKLKADSIAKQQYEDVVQRSSDAPPPPRDPVLFEYGWGEDNYYISIFPAVFDSTRKVRIRYLIPAFNIDGVNKIAYPYSFTANPVVTVKTGEGVSGYIVEAQRSKKLYNNPLPLALDAATYSFKAYGTSACQTISYIVPVLPAGAGGSVMYCGSPYESYTSQFGGEMCHVALMSAQQALAQSPIKEDYVVLWRWNHPDILARYARQIVEQSSLLKKFLATLNGADKRAALVISREGEAPITFHLDRQGGDEFNRMLAYLDSLGRLAVVDPPTGPYKQTAAALDTARVRREFDDALRAALDLFERDAAGLKHLLILTAGPELFSTVSTGQDIEWDSTIDVDMLASYCDAKQIDSSIIMRCDMAYWPGADISGLFQKYHSRLNAWATVGNGADTTRVQVLASPAGACASYCTWQQTADMHLFSEEPLVKRIRWSLFNGASPLGDFTESPRVVSIADGMQYSRLIGSSPYLVPMAASMPTSIASTVGFVDRKYSLVALEEDALPEAIARHYESQGVPQLNPEDIFPAPNEHMEPVGEWLIANPPKSLSRSVTLPGRTYYYYESAMDFAGGDKRFAVIDMVVPAPVPGNGQALVMPIANTVSSVSAGSYPDYTAAVIGKTESGRPSIAVSDLLVVKGGRLLFNTERFAGGMGKTVSIALFTCTGKKIGIWNITVSKLGAPVLIAGLGRGAYIARIVCGATVTVRRVIVR